MKLIAILLIAASPVLSEPTTQPARRAVIELAPTDPPVVPVLGAVSDYSRPAYIPAFAKPQAMPALMEQRGYALRFTSPAIAVYPVYPVYPYFGFHPALGHGVPNGRIVNHGFYR